MAESILGESLQFLDRLGIFDVVLPFLLVFTIVYAILEKTKVLGTEKVNDKVASRKNLNSMTSFVIAFFVVASSQLVATINTALANMVLLLLLSISFMILVGSFHGEQKEEGFVLDSPFKEIFMGIMFVGIVVIFLDALTNDGKSWLQHIFDFLERNWQNEWVMSLFLILVTVLIMVYITGGFNREKKEKKSDD